MNVRRTCFDRLGIAGKNARGRRGVDHDRSGAEDRRVGRDDRMPCRKVPIDVIKGENAVAKVKIHGTRDDNAEW